MAKSTGTPPAQTGKRQARATSTGPAQPTAPMPQPKLVTVRTPRLAAPDLKKRELIDLVADRAGIRKKDAKPVVEAMLEVLGDTLAEGRELNLPPLGKLRINRSEDKGSARIIVCRLRQSRDAETRAADRPAEASDPPDPADPGPGPDPAR